MKKKVTLIALILILVTLAVTGSLAYFRAEDEVKNVMSFGTVEIVQHEMEHDASGWLQEFTQGQVLAPIVNVNSPQEDPYYIEKLVTVENVGDSEAYIRTFIAFPASLESILVLDTDKTGKWIQDTALWNNAMIDSKEYKVISYTYHRALKSSETTEEVLTGVYLDPRVDAQINPATNTRQFCIMDADENWVFADYDINGSVDVFVVTQASQTTGLPDNPQEALNTAFSNSAPDFN